jgi:hypothetical protein
LPTGEGAARRVIDHDGVAIVDDAERNGLVIKFELRKVGELGVADIYGRLVVARLASGEGRIERTPVLWIFLALVAPMRSVRFLGARD